MSKSWNVLKCFRLKNKYKTNRVVLWTEPFAGGSFIRSLQNTDDTATDESGNNSDVDSATNSSSCSSFSDFESKLEKQGQSSLADNSSAPYVQLKSEKSDYGIAERCSSNEGLPEFTVATELPVTNRELSTSVIDQGTIPNDGIQTAKSPTKSLSNKNGSVNGQTLDSLHISRHNSLNTRRGRRLNKRSGRERRCHSANTPTTEIAELPGEDPYLGQQLAAKHSLTRTNSNSSNISSISQTTHELFLSISSDISGLASQSTHLFDDFFGVERGYKDGGKPARYYIEKRRDSGNMQDPATFRDNESFIKDIIHRIIIGEGISWLKTGRLRRLMEKECYRQMTLRFLRKGTIQTRTKCDHVPDVVRHFL